MSRTFVSTAVEGQAAYSDKAYFFLGDQYVRYDWKTDRVDANYPASTRLWGLPANYLMGVDAALNGQGPFAGKLYFFRGDQYVRYDWAQDRVDQAPAGLSAWGMPAPFTSGVDAALSGQAGYAGKAYFFRGGNYIRYDWGSNKIDKGPTPLTAWNFPPAFLGGVDAALNGAGRYAGKAYFFKGDHYLRYDWASDRVEFVGDLSAWPGVQELLSAGAARSQALLWIAAAVPQITAARAALKANTPPFLVQAMPVGQALVTHFHLDLQRPAAAISALDAILVGYQRVVQTLDNNAMIRFRTDAEARGDRAVGGDGQVYIGYGVHGGPISFTSRYNHFGPMCQAAMMLHEGVHVIDARSGEAAIHISEFQPEYNRQTAEHALHNPSSYCACAQHIFFGRDERFGAGRPRE